MFYKLLWLPLWFKVLFGILDNETERLGIDNYTLECTSLEQIFLDMERDVAEPQTQKLLEKIGLKKMDSFPLNDLDTKSEISSQLSEATVGKSHFLFKISPLDGNHQEVSWFCIFSAQEVLHSTPKGLWKLL